VREEHQGKGIGSGLFSRSTELLASQGHKSMLIHVLKGNESSIRFYLSKGATACGEDIVVIDGVRYLDNAFEYDLT
jgi:GNAT superfamily N-acetyltransferase